METDNSNEALLPHLEACEARELAARREHFSGEWAFLPISHHEVRRWAEIISDSDEFGDVEKSFALQFVGDFAYYSDGYNVAVTAYKPETERDAEIRRFIGRLEARMLARVVYRFDSDEHSTIGLLLGHRVCRHVYERIKAKCEAA